MTVYFIRAADTAIKIGFTANDPRKRLAKVQSDCPIPLEFLGAVPGLCADERALHVRVLAHRIHGDWFRLHNEVFQLVAVQLARPDAWKVPEKPIKQAKYDHPVCRFRAANRLTLQAMGKHVGLSEGALASIESGRVKMSTRALIRVSKFTQIPFEQLRPDLYRDREAAT